MSYKVLEKGLGHKKTTGAVTKYELIEYNETIRLTRDPSEVIWSERYRPRIIEDLILPSTLEAFVKQCIVDQQIPNLLLYSSSGGLGKDSIISVLINHIPNTLLTINASLHRNIDTIRTTVVDAISRKSVDGSRKVIYLNEVGGLTKTALDSLKALIEDYSKNASFIMTTNTMMNITHPLQSRFQFFEMDVIPKDERGELAKRMFIRMQAIMEIEGVAFSNEDLKTILLRYFPKYRDLMIGLQKFSTGGELQIGKDELDSLSVILDHITNNELMDLIRLSETVDVHIFLSQLVKQYRNLVEDIATIPDLIVYMDELQTKLNNRVPFPSISFLQFCVSCMGDEIKFKKGV